MVFRKRNYRRKAPRRKLPYKKRGTRGKGLTKLIKSVISRQTENKVIEATGYTGLSNYFANVGTWNTNNIVPLTPYSGFLAMSQGTGQGARIGNLCKTRKCFIKFVMYPAPYGVTTNPVPAPQDIRIVIVKVKDTPVSLTSSTGAVASMFQNGNSATAPAGGLMDMVRDINTNVMTCVYDKIFKIGFSSSNGTGGSAGQVYNNNNDYKLNVIKKIDVTRFCPKVVKFNDNATTPVTPTLQMIILPSAADGTGSNQTPLYWQYQLHYEWEDL